MDAMPPLPVELAARFTAAIEAAFGAEYAGTDPVLRRSQQPRFGDYQANAAMALGKRVGAPPRDVAARIVEHLDTADLVESTEIAGPGFINVHVRPDALAPALPEAASHDRLAVPKAAAPETVVVDYSSP